MMKALYWLVSAAVTLAGVGIMGAGAGVQAKENEKMIPESTTQYEEITALEVELVHARFTCTAEKDAKDVSVTVRNAKKPVTVTDESGTLTIRDEQRTFRFFDFGNWLNEPQPEVEVTVPQGQVFTLAQIVLGSGDGSKIMDLQTEQLRLNLGSGSLAADGVTVQGGCLVDLASGNLSMQDFTVADALTGHMGSGAFRLDGGKAGSMTMECASGKQVFDHMEIVRDLSLHTASGSLKSTDLTVGGLTRLELASGNVNMSGFTPGNETTVKYASGNLDITLTGKQEDYSFQSANASGNTTIGTQSGKQLTIQNGSKRFISQGTSGDLNVQFAE